MVRVRIFLFFFCPAVFFSCGIENYIYLEAVQYVNVTGVNSAVVQIPDNTGMSEFRYYAVYYRIYLSDQSLESITTDYQRSQINPALASHYNAIDPYTSNDNVSPNAIASVFSSLNYHSLYYFDASTNSEYSSSQLLLHSGGPPGFTGLIPYVSGVNFSFITSAGASLTITDSSGTSSPLYLYRSQDRFTPRPSRLFVNTTGAGNLSDPSIISGNVNADVERKTTMSSSNRYAFVSLYIVAVGMDNNYGTIYSRPKHIGIFRLPQ
ncbi:MAG: hypothetical protein LBQ44_02165 [Treponema sp.]|jgi:hypothetical protein|nr:hypothetical protein [Treponema sp.]